MNFKVHNLFGLGERGGAVFLPLTQWRREGSHVFTSSKSGVLLMARCWSRRQHPLLHNTSHIRIIIITFPFYSGATHILPNSLFRGDTKYIPLQTIQKITSACLTPPAETLWHWDRERNTFSPHVTGNIGHRRVSNVRTNHQLAGGELCCPHTPVY